MSLNPPQNLHRRQFLKQLSAVTLSAGLPLAACTHKKFYHPDEDILLSAGSDASDGNIQNILVTINLTRSEKRIIELPFPAHDVLIDPQNKFRIICIEKNGDNACAIDLQTQQLSSRFNCSKNQLFSGHGAFSKDGKNLYTIEVSKNNQQGIINIRDAKTFARKKQYSSYGLQPHDCQLIENNILVASNTGLDNTAAYQPSLAYIKLSTGELIKQVTLDDDLLNCGHFEITQDKQIIVASAPLNTTDLNLSGGVSMQQPGEKIVTMTEPELVINRMTGEALSISINKQHQLAAITHPQANLLTFWSIENKKIIKAIGIENPRGISQTFDGKFFIVSYGNKPAIAKISTDALEPQADSILQPTLSSGDHLVNWSQKIREIMPARIYD